MASATGLTRSEAAKIVGAFFSAVTESLKQGSPVRLSGFGTFRVAERARPRDCFPASGARIALPGERQPRFRPGKVLKDAVN